MSKEESLIDLYNKYKQAFEGNEIVMGDGNLDSHVILVGEAPGRDEVKLSKPFVGAAGRNLHEFLDKLGIEKDAIFITNAIKYRLSKINVETGKKVNRPATIDEINMSREYLFKEISIINPRLIVTLGNVPLKSVINDKNTSIGEMHGKLLDITIYNSSYKLFPLYHPASIIYNRNLKGAYDQDVLKLKVILEREYSGIKER